MNVGLHKPLKANIRVTTAKNPARIEWTTVEAAVYGDFAIHRPIGPKRAVERWTLTHIKSGRRLAHNLLYKYQLEGLIVAIADLDWDFEMFDEIPSRTKKYARDRITAFERCDLEEQRRWSQKIPAKKTKCPEKVA